MRWPGLACLVDCSAPDSDAVPEDLVGQKLVKVSYAPNIALLLKASLVVSVYPGLVLCLCTCDGCNVIPVHATDGLKLASVRHVCISELSASHHWSQDRL